MITTEQRGIVAIARDRLRLTAEPAWSAYLREHAGCDNLADLSAAGFARLTDRFIIDGFHDGRYVTPVEADYVAILRLWQRQFGLNENAFAAVASAADASEPDCYDGQSFRRMCRYFLLMGASLDLLDRHALTPKQVALLHVAKRACRLDKDEEYFRLILVEVGGVLDVAGLSVRGFDRVLAYLVSKLDFVMPTKARPAKRPSFGRRPGMATPAQVQLIRELWLEWSGGDDEDALNAWLERFHRVSSLRFLTSAAAGNVLTALKAMKGRRRAAGGARRDA